MVSDNNLAYPDRIETTTQHDETWALETREIQAWTNSYYLSFYLYGAGFILWGMNMLLDNKGGDLHFYSHKYNTVLNWVPAILMFNAFNINASYVRNGDWYLNGVIDKSNAGANDVASDKVAWLFNPD